MDHLVTYYVRKAGGGRGDDRVGPIYISPPFVQRGHGIGTFPSGLFRAVRPIFWTGAKGFGKATLKALANEALRTSGRFFTGLAHNPTVSAHYIIPQNVTESFQNFNR
jgi:hypothetical protein